MFALLSASGSILGSPVHEEVTKELSASLVPLSAFKIQLNTQ